MAALARPAEAGRRFEVGVVNAAVRRRDHDELLRLHVDDYDVNSVDPASGLSPLATAAKYGMFSELEILYSMGADVSLVCDPTTELTAVFVLITSTECPPAMRLPCLRLMCSWSGCDVDAACSGESGLEHITRRTPVGIAPAEDLEVIQELVLLGAAVEGVFISRATRGVMLAWASEQLANHEAAMTMLLAANSGVDEAGAPCVLRRLPADVSMGNGALATVAALAGLRSSMRLQSLRQACWVWLDALDQENYRTETHAFAFDQCLMV